MNPLETEIAISALQSTGDFVVLRRLDLERDHRFTRKIIDGSEIAVCIDTETTGLDCTVDKIIEIGMVAFEYDPATSRIIRIIDRYSGFEDPGVPLSKEITEITGISDAMLSGKSFDDDQVARFAGQANLVIAHNASFDRKFVEARFPIFKELPWACTVTQVNWAAERIGSRTLEFLLYKCGGYFINAHRALDDAEGLLGLLLGDLPLTGEKIFKALSARANEITSRICAVGSPFDKKDMLKQRGYSWYDGSKGGSKAWWTTVPYEKEQEELDFLAREIYPGGKTDSVEISRIDAFSRFSDREA